MTTKTKSASESLAALDERLQAAQDAVAEVDRKHTAAHRRVQEVEAEIGQALAADESTKTLEAEFAKSRSSRDNTPWAAMRLAASEKLREARAERVAVLFENLEAIVAERTPNAQSIPEDIKALLSQSLERLMDWHRERHECSTLFGEIPGLDGSDLANMPGEYETLMRDIRRALMVELPAPLPRSVGPNADDVPPKSRTVGGYVATLVSTGSGEVIAQ